MATQPPSIYKACYSGVPVYEVSRHLFSRALVPSPGRAAR